MEFREATDKDITNIATLHTLSWQENYSEALSTEYLQHQVLDERLAVWTRRLQEKPANQLVLLAEENGMLCGFIYAYGEQHPEHGTIIDNLHIHANFKGQGLGTKLLAAAATWACENYQGSSLYLEVLDCNTKARKFYLSLGAKHISSGYWQTPCGNKAKEHIYSWHKPSKLTNQT
ncbi:GNAT family N-acetyltransferase [Thalassomonas actiniarum]|uniref:GNAT family N-acetyltransferase n=1 Tax=Thalassomonas actiniarum TaxID=485447 RepID=A0AAE9YMW6_9GAMM|nr:GNAT family N-acetyltransferase [Thalassomonas actiniarum]WDD98075.1 GNAT family N-acetyltransferase [Thalassomonas actiniarum]